MMSASNNLRRRMQPLLGTFVEIAAGGPKPAELDRAIDAAFGHVATVHRLMSFHDARSDIAQVNRHAASRSVTVHPWTYAVLSTAHDLYLVSGGLFDVTMAPVLQRLGLLPSHRDDDPPPEGASAGLDALELLPDRQIRFHGADLRVDLGGIAKGFAVDLAIQTLRDHGVSFGIVNAGGDLAAFGPRPFRVQVRDPWAPDRMLDAVNITDEALASTGSKEGHAGRYTAIIDPRTRAPSATIVGATVRAKSCMLADALTKIVVILGEDSTPVLRRYEACALFVSERGDVCVTRDWIGSVSHAA
jgi:thiamine biosynthesis lipoprotein